MRIYSHRNHILNSDISVNEVILELNFIFKKLSWPPRMVIIILNFLMDLHAGDPWGIFQLMLT